uniref:Uncharacterized protein n=1 Tax=Picea sitchensis TaxID=3332 RepID=A9NNW6_PICSI|nr:unknown [Picea sitchensis]
MAFRSGEISSRSASMPWELSSGPISSLDPIDIHSFSLTFSYVYTGVLPVLLLGKFLFLSVSMSVNCNVVVSSLWYAGMLDFYYLESFAFAFGNL